MILGLACIVVGNILIWQSDQETTQYFTGWVVGVFLLAVSGGLPRIPRIVSLGVSAFFIIANEQKTTGPKQSLNCVHGEQRVIGGLPQCVCVPPYIGTMCDECPPGAVVTNEGSGDPPICKTCKHQYIFPHCRHLQFGYKTETECNPNWVESCMSDMDLSLNPKTYGEVNGNRNKLFDVAANVCHQNQGTVYCDKCKDGHAGRNCCKDGYYGQNCSTRVSECDSLGDYDAALKNNELPTDYGLVNPKLCYTLDDDTCTCGGEFIGDMLCDSGYCIDGKCTDLSRIPEFNFRCKCDIGVGPDCETPTCYGGTRMYNGTSICRCDAKHTSSYKGSVFDACEVTNGGTCYPGLYGSRCEECQCAVNLTTYTDDGVTNQCAKNRYGVFDRDFRTKDLLGGCRDSGTCTNEPDDCGDKVDGTDRCMLFTNPTTFTAILFSGNNCTDTKDSKCAVWEPCQPR